MPDSTAFLRKSSQNLFLYLFTGSTLCFSRRFWQLLRCGGMKTGAKPGNGKRLSSLKVRFCREKRPFCEARASHVGEYPVNKYLRSNRQYVDGVVWQPAR